VATEFHLARDAAAGLRGPRSTPNTELHELAEGIGLLQDRHVGARNVLDDLLYLHVRSAAEFPDDTVDRREALQAAVTQEAMRAPAPLAATMM
jgi:hypothetical protein